MLKHLRQTRDLKESLEISALCAEYLSLSYHGMRAKEKDFRAQIKTDFDKLSGRLLSCP